MSLPPHAQTGNIAQSSSTTVPISTANTNPSTDSHATGNTLNATVRLAAISNIFNENILNFYFLFYDIKTATILKILKNSSPEMLTIFENFHDYFSLANLDGHYSESQNTAALSTNYGSGLYFHTLASNNIHARQILKRQISNVYKINNEIEMTKFFLSQLPISSQSYTTTPYLSHDLFSYDEKLISNIERPKSGNEQIIKFNNRETGSLLFKMYSGSNQQMHMRATNSANNMANRSLVEFLFHPREPFCMSIHRAPQEYNVNFHVLSKNNLI